MQGKQLKERPIPSDLCHCTVDPTSKERHDGGVINFLNENGGDTAENRKIARKLDVNVQGNDCMIS